jgi:predicted transcriptional regulator
MDVPIELENRLTRLARQTGGEVDVLLEEAIKHCTDEEERFLAAVDSGIAAADRGDFVEDEEVRVWLEKRARS